MSKLNKFYYVYDINDPASVNIVIATTIRQAKLYGSNCDNVMNESWIDVRAKAIRGGELFHVMSSQEIEMFIEVLGKGFVYTDLKPQLDDFWYLFVTAITQQNRLKEIKEDVTNECTY